MVGGKLTTTVSAEGRVVLPKTTRKQLQWDMGTRLVVERVAVGVLLTPVRAIFAATRPGDVFGCLGPVGEAKSVEEMDTGVAMEIGRRQRHNRY